MTYAMQQEVLAALRSSQALLEAAFITKWALDEEGVLAQIEENKRLIARSLDPTK